VAEQQLTRAKSALPASWLEQVQAAIA
jgi:hypothetical protein